MFKSVASESNEGHESHKMGGKSGAGGEGNGDEEGSVEGAEAAISMTSTTVSAPAATDQCMHTPEFRGYFVEFVHVQTLMALRLATMRWNAASDALINEITVHGGKDISWSIGCSKGEDEARNVGDFSSKCYEGRKMCLPLRLQSRHC